MRSLGMMITMMFISLSLASAATVNFNDGRVVQGDIIKQDAKSLQITVNGVTMTYYADEIKDVDGTPFASAQAGAAVSPEKAKPQLEAEPVSAPSVSSPAAVIDPDKKALILEFINVFGTRSALEKNFQLMLEQIQKQKPDEAKKIRDRVKVDEIIDRLLPIYDRNFTTEDLKAYIAFYGSDEGQKLIKTIPLMMKESVQESIKYMQEKFPEAKKTQP